MTTSQKQPFHLAYTGVNQAPSQLFERCGSSDPEQVATEVASCNVPPSRTIQGAAHIRDLLSQPLDKLTEYDQPQF